MWFLLLGIALLLVLSGGLYFRHRFVRSIIILGAPARSQKLVRWLIPLLLFAYPLGLIASVLWSIALGSESFSIEPGGIWLWLIVYPFWLSVLILVQSLPLLIVLDLLRFAASKIRKFNFHERYWAMSVLVVVAFFSLYTPARIVLDRDDLNVREYQLGSGADKPFKIVFWGDLQRDAHTGAERTQKVLDLINREQADLILFGGDWINTGAAYIDSAASAGGQLKSRLGTYSVRGDHEHFAYRDKDRSVLELSAALAKQGVEMPHNEVRWFVHEGKRIGVAFLSHNYMVRSPAEETRKLIAKLADADYSILLTHQFDRALEEVVKDQVDLVLAAHTHGGQVNPVLGVVHVPLARVETSYIEGRYQLGEHTTVIVTAGIGFSTAPFRYASPASIEVLYVRP
ncbi:MAG: metallophosphoesterase [Kofleriaceae bacterium]|nr:metallophosphoesterase [Kofleriaceae bacterium]